MRGAGDCLDREAIVPTYPCINPQQQQTSTDTILEWTIHYRLVLFSPRADSCHVVSARGLTNPIIYSTVNTYQMLRTFYTTFYFTFIVILYVSTYYCWGFSFKIYCNVLHWIINCIQAYLYCVLEHPAGFFSVEISQLRNFVSTKASRYWPE